MFPINELYRNSDISILHWLNLQKLSFISFGSRTFYVMGSWWSSTTCKGESTICVDANCLQSDISYPPRKNTQIQLLLWYCFSCADSISLHQGCSYTGDINVQTWVRCSVPESRWQVVHRTIVLPSHRTGNYILTLNLSFLGIIIWSMIKSRNEDHPFRWYWLTGYDSLNDFTILIWVWCGFS